MWDQYDSNGDGVLQKAEAFEFLRMFLEENTGLIPDEEELEKHFKIMDDDGNGTIDKKEAQKFMKGV